MASMSDVAKLAGVSVSTVSLVCNNKSNVSDEMRARVQRAMQQLDYQPSQLARSLKLGRSGIIGVIVPDLAHPFFAEFVAHLEHELQAKGFKTMVCGTAGREEVEQSYLDMLEQKTMDMLIMGAHSLDVSRYISVSRPLIALDRLLSDTIPTIRADKMQIARMAAELFLSRGRHKVVQLVSSGTIRDYDHEKDVEFRRLLELEGVEVVDVPVGFNCFTVEQNKQVVRRVFDEVDGFDGVLATDLAIAACLAEARRVGISVPEDLSLVAIDGTYLSRALPQTMTAIVQPLDAYARKAAELAEQLVRDGDLKPGDQIFEVHLQQGETL
ncbi:MAG: LacI family DNA-binding transcriptional regulator [Atopobiaceae bacterium]|nr:LacI family DNA-binding transcriptional regulator [Atopobiaceae bacterium]